MRVLFRGSSVRRIAQSGTAEVLLTVQRGFAGLERLVVVKALLPRARQDTRFVESFVAQMRHATTLHHQNLIDVQDVVHDAADTFVTREYLSGEDLGSIVRLLAQRKEHIPLPLACHVVAQAAAGAHHAHSALDPDGSPLGLVHGRLTPNHILLGYTGATKLLDVGLDEIDPEGFHQDPTARLARQSYRAPEQLTPGAIDRRTDVYTLGVVLYELLTRQPLFWHSQGDVKRQVLEQTVPPARTLNSEVPRELDDLVMATIARDPARRPQSALVLQQRLEDVLRRQRAPAGEHELGAWLTATLAERRTERQELERELISESRHSPGGSGDWPLGAVPSEHRSPGPAPVVPSGRPTRISGPLAAAPALPDEPVPPQRRPRRRRPLVVGLVAAASLLLSGLVGVLLCYAPRQQPAKGTAANSAGAFSREPKDIGPARTGPRHPSASLLVRLKPAGAQLLLDGKTVINNGDEAGVLVPVTPGSTVRLEARKSGFETVQREVEAPRTGRRDVLMQLEASRPTSNRKGPR